MIFFDQRSHYVLYMLTALLLLGYASPKRDCRTKASARDTICNNQERNRRA